MQRPACSPLLPPVLVWHLSLVAQVQQDSPGDQILFQVCDEACHGWCQGRLRSEMSWTTSLGFGWLFFSPCFFPACTLTPNNGSPLPLLPIARRSLHQTLNNKFNWHSNHSDLKHDHCTRLRHHSPGFRQCHLFQSGKNEKGPKKKNRIFCNSSSRQIEEKAKKTQVLLNRTNNDLRSSPFTSWEAEAGRQKKRGAVDCG